MLLWALGGQSSEKVGFRVDDIVECFVSLRLAKPNTTRIREHFRKSRNVVTVFPGMFVAAREHAQQMAALFPPEKVSNDVFDIESIAIPPFVPSERRSDLARMVRTYAQLFLLENSMRGLIEKVLSTHLGPQWWDVASNASMKKKHADRANNEQQRKWAPTRTEFGPLYALDWPDLITLMRKYPDQFIPYISDIDFLHRYDDAGSFRNVVAHNGVLRDNDDFERIRIYYRDWIKQLS